MGVLKRLLPARREAAPARHPAAENGSSSDGVEDPAVAVGLRGGAGDRILQFQREHGGADRRERAAEEAKRAAQQRAEPH